MVGEFFSQLLCLVAGSWLKPGQITEHKLLLLLDLLLLILLT